MNDRDARRLQRTEMVAAGVFVAATAVLAVQFVTPPSVVVTAGDASAAARVGRRLAPGELAGLLAVAAAFGASGTYLLVGGRSKPPDDTAEATASQAPVTPEPAAANAGLTPDARPATENPGPTDAVLETRRREWEDGEVTLADSEGTVYETVLDADGVVRQAEIVDRTDLSKATVSRALDNLESRGLVERERDGMGNTVRLQ